jgi:hypothetical protein
VSTQSKAWSTRKIYQFIKGHRDEYDVQKNVSSSGGHPQRFLRLAWAADL